MQYRYGSIGSKPELSYPKNRVHPKNQFIAGRMMYSGGGGAYLKFRNGDYSYTIFTGIGKGWQKEGVVVEKSDKRIAFLQCKGPWTSEIGPDLFEKIQLSIDPKEAEFEVP